MPGRELLDRPVLGGRAYLGSLLWSVSLLALGLVLWAVGAVVERDGVDPRWLLATLAAVCAVVVFRRTAPAATVGAATLVAAADAAIGPSMAVLIVYGDALYAACVWGRPRVANTVLAVVCVVGAAVTAGLAIALVRGYLPGGPLSVVQGVGLYVLVFASPVISGMSVREHRRRTALERERARQIERMAELDRRNAVAEERGRVARELHDVIANHLSAIAVQSTAALSMREADPERTRRILTVIRDSSLHGLTDMRAMIRVLRGADESPQLEAVTPRLDDADRLFADAREAGLAVEVVRSGPARPLPPHTDAAAYRVLQESLTNALRYADPMRAEVAVEFRAGSVDGDHLVLTVTNPAAAERDGAGPPGAAVLEGHGAGAGLTGMRERVLLLGGRFSAGPLGARTWRVRAEIPLPPAESEASEPEAQRGVAGGAVDQAAEQAVGGVGGQEGGAR
nr:histidine kinase [Streptomonospora sp. PA3]